MTQGVRQKWVEAAYSEFASLGPDFSLKALSEKSKLPRASLYYHFASKEELLEELLLLHQENINKYHSHLAKNVKSLIPDLYEVVYSFKEGILFHRQLLLHPEKDEFYSLYRSTNEHSFTILLPHIKRLFETNVSNEEFIQFYHTLTDAWYIRLDPNHFSVESMIALAMEIMEHTLGLFSGSISPKSK
ncbi:TetR/AcrR family transcriptional regulator [Algoriphagus formosus]|jgi:AcrR family transcriptional regulator|uniref:TetR/AcrR family transcriptional regulator n=1 Tax=Algoriphagus formosus TaxID=2007308 RepID=A0A4R5UWC6_9BACT|nr:MULTISPECIES: TetR/AcrR family transcriptional regulator [Algoriphagus]TDK43405.1 TetR/AcrR family transcriptional regulator [Algoriphagus aquimaris]